MIFYTISLVSFSLIAYWLLTRYFERRYRRAEFTALLRSRLIEIEVASKEFDLLCSYASGYFANYQLVRWQGRHREVFELVQTEPIHRLGLRKDEVGVINAFIDRFQNAEAERSAFNHQFVNHELKTYKHFFDNIEGRKLDDQQRRAVITDEDNNLIIAGAGSGKTTTIVGKVSYVTDRYKVRPDDILLISFTNKSASTLAQRINIPGVDAKTFHRFGMDVIVAAEGKQPSIFDGDQFVPLVTRIFTQLMTTELSFMERVTNYFSNYLKPVKSQFDFKSQGEYIQYMKDNNFRTYKSIEVRGKETVTYRMEVVKSIEECKIANFLLFNNVNYEYEWPYEYDTADDSHRQYKPDFTITQGINRVYLEHFGISRAGTVPNWFSGKGTQTASEKYQSDMEWKRNTHAKYNTTLIETFSYEMQEGILFDSLSNKLRDAGIVLKPKTEQEIWDIISANAKEEVNSFIKLICTFINLLKSNDLSLGQLLQKNEKTPDLFSRRRNEAFINIVRTVLERYESHLGRRGEIDFSDMINKASGYVREGKFRRDYKYVIIDEFQDISIGRYNLVKAIKDRNPSCRLFCVGDDWQSIYRFAGSDTALFREFRKYFGCTQILKIETTYRFQQPLISLSTNFIQKNPNQEKKDLKGVGNRSTDYKFMYSVSDMQDDTEVVQAIFDELLSTIPDIHNREISVLGRYNFDIDRIRNTNRVFRIQRDTGVISYIQQSGGKELRAQFLTVHKSKGLEADIVIILNCNSGKLGFPSDMTDDTVLNLLLSEADEFDNSEERRLFYVAMTRARQLVYFVSDAFFKSKFISEIEVELGTSPNRKCPRCKTADVVLRKSGTAKNGGKYRFYGCVNFRYGCEFTTTEWD